MYYPVNRQIILSSRNLKVVSSTLKRTSNNNIYYHDGLSIQRRGLAVYSQHHHHHVLFLDKNAMTMPSPYERHSNQYQKVLFSTIISPSSAPKNLDVLPTTIEPPPIINEVEKKKSSENEDKNGKKKKKPVIDSRVWPIAASTLVGGCSVGVLFPVMPIFVQKLGLSDTDFGMVVSIIGLTRLLINIPAAYMSDKFGRRSTLIGGPVISAIGLALTATARSLSELAFFRLLTGMGGGLQMTGAQMYLSDISTPENRARTMAPMGIAFATGATVGPVLGGFLSENYGLQAPFYFVASSVAIVAAINSRMIPETKVFDKNDANAKKTTLSQEFKSVVEQWRPLVKNPDMRRILALNLTYWCVASGCQWTLLPLYAANFFHFSASELGGMFALLSAIGIVGLGPAAYISDKFGRKATIFPASLTVATALAAIPFATTHEQLFGLVALYGIGATLFNSAPAAFVSDMTTEKTRGQALALLRSAGDAGLFLGASGFGALSHSTSPAVAFSVASVGLAVAGTNFVFGRTAGSTASSTLAGTTTTSTTNSMTSESTITSSSNSSLNGNESSQSVVGIQASAVENQQQAKKE